MVPTSLLSLLNSILTNLSSSSSTSKLLPYFNTIMNYLKSFNLKNILSLFHYIKYKIQKYISKIKFDYIISTILYKILKLTDFIISTIYYCLAPNVLLTLISRHTISIIIVYLFIFTYDFVKPIQHYITNNIASINHVLGDSYLTRYEDCEKNMLHASSYAEWEASAKELDILEGKYEWKLNDKDNSVYDAKRIRYNLDWLRKLVDNGDVKGIMHYLRSRLLRNLGGMGSKSLYLYLRCGTKTLIEDYINEVVRALQYLCVIDSIPPQQLYTFFSETRHAFGRTALLLSGGATLGLYHNGVVFALLKNNLLPRIISGTSVGSIVTSLVGTHTDEEILDFDNPLTMNLDFFPNDSFEVKWNRLFSTGAVLDMDHLQKCIRNNIPDMTFQEAFEHTGRIINISIAPNDSSKDVPHLLNYLTTPNVLVWSAACASCAVPYLFRPVELLAKDADGNIVPYFAEGDVKFSDGSFHSDLPMTRLSELFNVNHFIVSQVNPHVIPFMLSDAYSRKDSLSLATIAFRTIRYLGRELKHILLNLNSTGVMFFPELARGLVDQKYTGDITLVPSTQNSDFMTLFTNPTTEKYLGYLKASERATWQKLSFITSRCEIEFTIDECVRRMKGKIAAMVESKVLAQTTSNMTRINSFDHEHLRSTFSTIPESFNSPFSLQRGPINEPEELTLNRTAEYLPKNLSNSNLKTDSNYSIVSNSSSSSNLKKMSRSSSQQSLIQLMRTAPATAFPSIPPNSNIIIRMTEENTADLISAHLISTSEEDDNFKNSQNFPNFRPTNPRVLPSEH